MDTAGARLAGTLEVPDLAAGLVLFAHGSGSSRLSPRNREVAADAQPGRDRHAALRPPHRRRGGRARQGVRHRVARRSARRRDPLVQEPPRLGACRSGTSAPAPARPPPSSPPTGSAATSARSSPAVDGLISPTVHLPLVSAPTLLVVGSRDPTVLDLNRQAAAQARPLRAPARGRSGCVPSVRGGGHPRRRRDAGDRVVHDPFRRAGRPIGSRLRLNRPAEAAGPLCTVSGFRARVGSMPDDDPIPRPDRRPRPRRRGRITTSSPSSHTEDLYLLQRAAGVPPADDSWRALRILSEFVDGFDALASIGPAVTVFGSARIGADDPMYRRRGSRSGRRPARARVRGDHRRRPGDHGGGQPRLPAKAAACRSAATSSCRTSSGSTRTSTSASTSATSSCAR